MLICTCPLGSALPDIPQSECPVNFGQIQKIIIQRKGQTTGGDPLLKATWTALLGAIDNTKVVITPYVSTPVTEPGAAKTFGGGNTTPGGIPILIGREPTKFTSSLMMASQETVKALKEIQCDSVQVYLVNEVGQIGLVLNPLTSLYEGIPVRSFFIGDLKFGGFEEPDMNGMEFYFEANWSDNFVAITPTDFSGLNLKAPYMTVTPAKLTAIKAGEEIAIAISANVSWTAESNQTWAVIQPDLGEGTDTSSVTVSTNSGSSPRSAVITFTAGNITRTFTITQSGT